jgi:hypothetical protein
MIARLRERLHRIRPWAVATTVAAFAMIAVGALTAALISVSTSNSAAIQAKGAAQRATDLANCVNNVLGERQKINDTPALLEQANADAAWARAIVTAVSLPKDAGPHQRAAATTQFIAAVNDYAMATADVSRILAAHQRARLAHPLGKC